MNARNKTFVKLGTRIHYIIDNNCNLGTNYCI